MPLVTAIFRGILRAFRGDLSLASACRRMVQCGAAVVFAAAAPGALPASAQSDPFAQPNVSVPSAPVLYKAPSGDSDYANILMKWARPKNNGGGRILEYRIIRQIKVLSETHDPVSCDSVSGYVNSGPTVLKGPDVFEFSNNIGSDIGHGTCVRWQISARNSAGWGQAAITDPLLRRPSHRDICSGARHVPLHGSQYSCVSPGRHLEGADFCKRAGGVLIWDPNHSNSKYKLRCEINNYHRCGERYERSLTLAPGKHTCALNSTAPGATFCLANSDYDLQHRECLCNGLTEEIENNQGAIQCGCGGLAHVGVPPKPMIVPVDNPIAGIDTTTCRCPAGKTYYPDTHACETTRPAVETNFDVNLVAGAGGTKTTANGVVKILHTRTVSFSMSVNVPSSLPSGSRPGSFTVRVGDSAAALCTGSFIQSGESGGKRHFVGDCPAVKIRAGEHDIAAKFRASGRDIQARLKLDVGDAQAECGIKKPDVNPIGGAWHTQFRECRVDQNAFYIIGDENNPPFCEDTLGCERLYDSLRQFGCNPPETLHKSGHLLYTHGAHANSDHSCVCADSGEATRADGSCYSDEEKALVAEFEREPLNLVSVVALLDQGVNPNLASGGVPLLFVAATLGDAEAVSILITAGADPNAQISKHGRGRRLSAGISGA